MIEPGICHTDDCLCREWFTYHREWCSCWCEKDQNFKDNILNTGISYPLLWIFLFILVLAIFAIYRRKKYNKQEKRQN